MAALCTLYLVLWLASVTSIGHGCPKLCTCSDKYGRHFAECSYKDLIEIPVGLPPNVSTLSLSANRIHLITLESFDNVSQVTSLWMAHNEILSVEEGSLAPLVHLRNLDISHNKIVHFPWEDLQNLTALQLLKMNHNQLVSLPRDAFASLQDLKSLRLNNNRFTAVAPGTFDGLMSLSHLQIFHNPFACTCGTEWLTDWISKTTITIPEQSSITCATPQRLKGAAVATLPKCAAPDVTITSEPDVDNATLYEDTALMLSCDVKGNPKPVTVWRIHTRSQRREFVLSSEEDDAADSDEDTTVTDLFKVFSNGTLAISYLRRKDSGNYSCSAANEVGKAEASASVEVVALPKPTPTEEVTEAPVVTSLSELQPVARTSILNSFHLPDLDRKDIITVFPTPPPATEFHTDHYRERAPSRPSHASKCGLSSNTKFVSNHGFNGSLDAVKQYTFDFGVIALGVSETEAKVRLNPLFLPKDGPRLRATEGPDTGAGEAGGVAGAPGNVQSSRGLYLCVTADHRHAAVQWSRIEEGVNTYLFRGLRPGANYSLCLTYREEDCEVQVVFTTRRRVPNLMIIISVSICLLTVSTVPLLGATCFHLVYKYRGKTYKLIMKAKDQYRMEGSLAANFNVRKPHAESQRQINGSEVDEEEGLSEIGDRERDGDAEESVVTESFTLSQYRGNADDCEVGSEYSDRLPLGAEAVNITSNYKYPNH